MSKRISVLSVIVMMAVAAMGCQSTETNKAESTPVQQETTKTETKAPENSDSSVDLVMCWWGNQVRNERTAECLQMYMDANPEVTVEGQFSEWSDYWNKLSTLSAGNALPDVITHDYAQISTYVESGLLIDLKPYIDSGVLDVSGVDEGLLESGTFGEGIYAIPWTVNAPAMLYNKTMLDELGITVKDNMNIDEFKEIARKVYEANGTKTDMGYLTGITNLQYMIRGLGGLVYKDGQMGATAEQYAYYYSLHADGLEEGWHVVPDIYAERIIGSNEQVPLVYGSSPDERSWCVFGYSNQISAMNRLAAEEGWEIGITSIPSPDVEKSNYLKPSMFLTVSRDSKYPEEAAKLLNYLMNDIPCNEVILTERGIPAVKTVAEAITPKLEDINIREITYINNVVGNCCSPIDPPNPEGSDEVTKQMNLLDEEVCYGKITPEEAGERLVNEGNAIMAAKQ